MGMEEKTHFLQFLQFAVIEFSPYKTRPKFLIYKYIKIIFLYLHTPAPTTVNCKNCKIFEIIIMIIVKTPILHKYIKKTQ